MKSGLNPICKTFLITGFCGGLSTLSAFIEDNSNILYENGNITNSVNYPNVDAGVCHSAQRITINHYNVSGMISKFTNVLSEYGVNIARMYNNSMDDVAYTVLDLDHAITDEVKEKFEKIDGVLRVRVIKGKK